MPSSNRHRRRTRHTHRRRASSTSSDAHTRHVSRGCGGDTFGRPGANKNTVKRDTFTETHEKAQIVHDDELSDIHKKSIKTQFVDPRSLCASYLWCIFTVLTHAQKNHHPSQNANVTYDLAHYYEKEFTKFLNVASPADKKVLQKQANFTRPVSASNYYDVMSVLGSVERTFARYPEEKAGLMKSFQRRYEAFRRVLTELFPAHMITQPKLNPSQLRVAGFAQQRQLLSLLVGDVPGTLFVDPRTGYVRNSSQIVHHILHLIRPFSMSTTTPGSYLYGFNRVINLFRSFSNQIMQLGIATLQMAFQWILLIYAAYLFMCTHTPRWLVQSAWTTLLRLWLGLIKFTTDTLVVVVERTGDTRADRLRDFQTKCKWFQDWLKGRMGVSANGDKELVTRGLQVGFIALTGWLLYAVKVDCGRNTKCSILFFTYQKWYDRFNLLRAAQFLAELEPGLFGDSTVSGLSDAQIGLMEEVQRLHEALDVYVDNVTPGALSELMRSYQASERSSHRQTLYLKLHEILKLSADTRIQTLTARASLLQGASDEIRGHHLFDQYGYPRDSYDIVKAYFCDWHRQQDQSIHKLPTVPFNGSTLHHYLDLKEWDVEHGGVRRGKTLRASIWNFNPINRSEFARRRDPNTKVSEKTVVTDDFTDWQEDAKERDTLEEANREALLRNKINIPSIFKDERGASFASWLDSILPGNTAARDAFRRYSGWTHKLSPPLRKRLIHEFDLVLSSVHTDYSRFLERIEEDKDRVFRHGHAIGRSSTAHTEKDLHTRGTAIFVFDEIISKGGSVDRAYTNPSSYSEAYKTFVSNLFIDNKKTEPEKTELRTMLYAFHKICFAEAHAKNLPHYRAFIKAYTLTRVPKDADAYLAYLCTVVYWGSIYLISQSQLNNVINHSPVVTQEALKIFPASPNPPSELNSWMKSFVEKYKLADAISKNWIPEYGGPVQHDSAQKKGGALQKRQSVKRGLRYLRHKTRRQCDRRASSHGCKNALSPSS